MLIIGLTGGIGSGKTQVSNYLASKGITVVDADVISREVVTPPSSALQDISQHFGSEFIQNDGTLNRGLLREAIFNNDNERQWLESLLHPLINELIRKQLSDSQSPYTILVSPLLFETQQKSLISRSLVIDVPENIQVERTQCRDNVPAAQVENIIAAQMPRDKRLSLADDVISNDQDVETLHANVDKLHLDYLKLTT